VIAVLGKRGEAEEPADPATAPVWSEITGHHNDVGFNGRYVSVEPIPRKQMAEHPWVLAGGGARNLKTLLESLAVTNIEKMATAVGFMCITKQDDVFPQPARVLKYIRSETPNVKEFVTGDIVRDWSVNTGNSVIFPYDHSVSTVALSEIPNLHRFLWYFRTNLENRKVFGGLNYRQAKKPWWEYGQIPKDRVSGLSIAFAFVATHNHFVLDRGGKVFKQSAPGVRPIGICGLS
jgi:hypothetical protein